MNIIDYTSLMLSQWQTMNVKRIRSFTLWLITILFLGCTSATIESERPELVLESTFLVEKNHTNPSIRGVWQSIGNGYLLEVREDSLLLYSYTNSFCYKEKNDYLEGLLNTQSQFERRGDTIGVYLTNYGAATKKLQTKKDFLRIEKLPDSCISFTEMTQLSANDHFKLYRETLQENYAFAQERQLDWTTIFEAYQDRNVAEDQMLFESMGAIATLTKDQHTKVIAQDGNTRQYRITPSALIVQKAFENQTSIPSLNDYFNLFFSKSKQHIADSLLHQHGQSILNGNIEWGKINDHVGYIHIFSFAGFLNRNYSRKMQIDSIKSHMNVIMDSLQHAEAIIVDVSFNFGGYDGSALTIASYFTEKPIDAFTSQVYHDGDFYEEDKVIIYPAATPFTKPVYLVMTDISRSAAEGFAMMMDALPNVTLVGTNTLGTLSGMLGKSVKQYYTTYSNQRLVNAKGEYFEVTGVEPDIELMVFPEENVLGGHLQAVKKVIHLIEENEKD